MPAANTFPLLNKQDILRGLQIGADSIGNVSSDDLENPTPIKVHAILKFFVINLLNEDPDEESFKQMEAKDMFEHQELHEDSTRSMAFFKACNKLMMTVGIHDFSFTDLVKPEKGRLRKQLSGVINFALFREEKLQRGVEITQEVDALAARKQEVEEEQERLMTEKSQGEATRRQEAPEAARIEEENAALAVKVQEAFNQHTTVHEESTALKAQLQAKKDELATTKFDVLNAKEELERLKEQIVPDPQRLKHDLKALQEALAHEKEALRQVEGKNSDAARGLEAVERVEREMEAVVETQAEAEGEQRKLREVQNTIAEIGKRQEGYKSKIFDQQLETKGLAGRKEVKEEALERLRAQRETRLADADKKLAAEQGVLDGLHAERSQHAKQLEEHEVEIRDLKDKLYKGQMDHNAETERVKQQQEQLAAQVRDYHKDLIKAMRQVSDQQSAAPAVAAS